MSLHLDGAAYRLSRDAAASLRAALDRALDRREEFLHTAGEYRPDGTYAVCRRGADSPGHAKVFDSFDALRRLYDRLPAEFDAEDLGRPGLTGGRRHLVVRHLCEHPGFDARLVSRQPLTGGKASGDDGG